MHMNSPEYIRKIKDRGPVVTIELEWPIFSLTAEAEVSKLEFREPTAGDVLLIGNPITRVDFTIMPPRIERDQAVYFDMLAELCGNPVPNLMKMAPTDVLACQAQLDRFFIPGFKTRPSNGMKENSSPLDAPPAP